MMSRGLEVGGRAAIEVEGLRKSYGDREAVRGIDLCVAAGEVFCLLGPNGAGKTTTVEILEGFRSRSGGTVRVLGFDPDSQPLALRQRLGIVLQQCALPGELKVAELVDAYRSYYRAPLPRRTLLSLVELEDDAGQLVRNLSGGQQRRVDLALALAGDPELVFLDEPTTGFDPAARRRSWNVIGNLAALGKSIVLTTHYLDEAQQLADRIAVVAGGRIIACDSPQHLADRHVAPTRISFEVPAEKVTLMPLTTGGSFESEGDHATIETRAPGEQLEALLSWARTEDLTLGALSVSPPSLEDVYLRLVADHVAEEVS
jgi:ABC-2 type transport system ATP-binding protein